MKNLINYYYNLYPSKLNKTKEGFSFYINNKKFVLKKYNRNILDLKSLVEISNELYNKGVPVSTFIMTKNKSFFIEEDEEQYILLLENEQEDYDMDLKDIIAFDNMKVFTEESSITVDMVSIWKERVDMFEKEVIEYNKEYPLIQDSFNYFIGLAENAIIYAQNAFLEEPQETFKKYVLSHNRFSKELRIKDLYDPLTFIIDYEIRDISEFLKIEFFNGDSSIDIIENLFRHLNLSKGMFRLLYARMLYPNYYFDLFEKIITGEKEEKELIMYTKRTEEYEDFLFDLHNSIKKYVSIPEIDWIMKKNDKNMI